MRGTGASDGCAVGPAHRVDQALTEPSAAPRLQESDPCSEVERLRTACRTVSGALTDAALTARGQARDVLAATAEMAADPALVESAISLVRDGARTAERAIWEAADGVRERLQQLGGHMGERTADILDVRDRIVAELTGAARGLVLPSHPVVLIADSLSPADTSTLDPSLVRAIVTVHGGPQSHSAILARALGIPAVVSADAAVLDLPHGTAVFVDGTAGRVSAHPTEEQVAVAERSAAARAQVHSFGGSGVLADGQRVPLLANVGSAAEAEAAAAAGAEGIGLLRTEFLFLDRVDEPGVEEQAQAYAAVFAHFPGRRVVVRTLDAGSDKPLPFLQPQGADGDGSAAGTEPNPALGMRGFRTHVFARDVLLRQVEAIALAAGRGQAQVEVMAPMITTAEESAEFARLVAAAGLPTAGVMIETPAAALCADSVLAPVGFASLGTNDLAQYALAFDRELPDYAGLQSADQPAVLRLIEAAARGAAASPGGPKPWGVCGEAAAVPDIAVALVGLGATSLSMSAPALGRVAHRLAEVTLDEAQEAARAALSPQPTDPARTSAAREPLTAAETGATSAGPVTRRIHVSAPTGLHARPAAMLAKAVKALDAEVTLLHATTGAQASGASVMDIMALGADPGDDVEVTATGPDAAAAVDAVEGAATGDA